MCFMIISISCHSLKFHFLNYVIRAPLHHILDKEKKTKAVANFNTQMSCSQSHLGRTVQKPHYPSEPFIQQEMKIPGPRT